jgi:hypothetical protein
MTREHFPSLGAFTDTCAAAPYAERCGIIGLLDSLGGCPAVREELSVGYHLLEERLACLERDLGRPYRAMLLRDLSLYVDAYAASVCHAHLANAGVCCSDEHSLRALIGILIDELNNEYDLDGLRRLVCHLDEMAAFPHPAESSGPDHAVPAAGELSCFPGPGQKFPARP